MRLKPQNDWSGALMPTSGMCANRACGEISIILLLLLQLGEWHATKTNHIFSIGVSKFELR